MHGVTGEVTQHTVLQDWHRSSQQCTSSCFLAAQLIKGLLERADEPDQAQCRAQCYQLPEFAATFRFHCLGLFLSATLKLGT